MENDIQKDLFDAFKKCADENPNMFDKNVIINHVNEQYRRICLDNADYCDYYVSYNGNVYGLDVRCSVDDFGFNPYPDDKGMIAFDIMLYNGTEEDIVHFDYSKVLAYLVGTYDPKTGEMGSVIDFDEIKPKKKNMYYDNNNYYKNISR